MVAHSLSILTQRFGRAGRSGQPATAILLTEPSVFQVKKKTNATRSIAEPEDVVKDEPNDENVDLLSEALGLDDIDAATSPEYRKKMEAGMQDWCMASGCRWDISDKYFNNPPRLNGVLFCYFVRFSYSFTLTDGISPLCCDNCLHGRKNDPEIILSDEETRLLALMDRLQTRTRPSASQDIIDVDALILPLAETPKRAGLRRTERLQMVRDAIIDWRSNTWLQHYCDCAWGPNTLIPDSIVAKLAVRPNILTIDDLKNEVPNWEFVDDYGAAILELIQKTDNVWKEEHAQKIQTKKDIRKRSSIENKERREEERRMKKRAETAQRRTAKSAGINTYSYPAVSQPIPWPSQPLFLPPGPSTSSYIYPQPLHAFSQPGPSTSSYVYPQPLPAFSPPGPSTSSHVYPQPLHAFSQPPHYLPQPIFFMPGPGVPQSQPQACIESRTLLDVTLTQNKPRDSDVL